MRFHITGNPDYSQEKIQLLKFWLERMKMSVLGGQIIENMLHELEEDLDSNKYGISPALWRRFLLQLVSCLEKGNKDIDAVKNAIDYGMLKKGPWISREDIVGEDLSMFMKVRHLFRYLKDSLPLFMDKEYFSLVYNWLKDGCLIKDKHFKIIKVEGNLPFNWAVFSEEVIPYFDKMHDIDQLFDRLGYSDFNKGDFIVELKYRRIKVKKLFSPTVLDAGPDPVFSPRLEGDVSSRTFDLTGMDCGIYQVIHDPVSLQDITSIRCIGEKVKDHVMNKGLLRSQKSEFYEIFTVESFRNHIESLTPDYTPLARFIKTRLHEKNICPVSPPLSRRSQESPDYLLGKAYERSNNNEFKLYFQKAVAFLLNEAQRRKVSPDYMAALLVMCQQCMNKEAALPLAEMVLDDSLKGINSTYGDLYRLALMAFARIQEGLDMTEIWALAIKDKRYTAAAFAALREQGVERVIQYLPDFVNMSSAHPESIDLEISLRTLYVLKNKKLSDEEITRMIYRKILCETQEMVKLVSGILKTMGQELNTENEGEKFERNERQKGNSYPIEPFYQKLGIGPDQSSTIDFEFSFLFAQNKEMKRAYELLNKTLNLTKIHSKDMNPVKSLLCRKFLSFSQMDDSRVVFGFEVWSSIAIDENNPDRKNRWESLLNQIMQGDFEGIRY